MTAGTERRARELLVRLGVTAKYLGFEYVVYAVRIAAAAPDSLSLVTKRLYPEVAKRFGTTPGAVERNIRTVIRIAWQREPGVMQEVFGRELAKRPSCAEFLAAVAVRCAE